MESVGVVSSAASSLEAAADAVESALDEALAFPAHLASGGELCDWLVRSPRLRAKFDALMSSVAVAAERAEAAQSLELRKIDHVVGSLSGADPTPTRADLRMGAWVAEFPEFESAFADGVLTREHVELLRKGIDNDRTRASLLGDQGFFVEQARQLSFADFRTAAQYWLHAVDPDGEEPRDQVIETRLRIARMADGTVSVSGVFDPLSGAALLSAVREEDQKLFRQDSDDDVSRSAAKRRADALIGLVARGHEHGGSGIPRALINIVMSQSVAEQILERLDNPFADVELDPHDIDGRCEFIDGEPLHPELALATLGVATLRRHVLDAKGRMLDVSLNARAFPQWMRNAALITSRGRCSEPGCDAPFAWLHADHRRPRSKHGPTRLDNCDPLCGPANLAKSDTWHERPPDSDSGDDPTGPGNRHESDNGQQEAPDSGSQGARKGRSE